MASARYFRTRGSPLIRQQRAEADIHEDRDANDRQRDQKELNGEGGRSD
jgi:hypothetical protein